MLKPLFCSPEYLVDSRGFVLSQKGVPLKPSLNQSGYQIINVRQNGKQIGLTVHRAVAIAFVDGYAPGLQINHKDGDKLNNCAENLEWVSGEENIQHAINTLHRDIGKWNERPVIGIDRNSGEQVYSFQSIADAARSFCNGTNKNYRYIQNCISRVLNGVRKSYRNCIWRDAVA